MVFPIDLPAHAQTAIIPAIIAGASLLGKLFSGASKDRADARAAQAKYGLEQDQTALQRFLAAQGAQNQAAQTDLQRKQYSLTAPGQRASNSVRGDILATTRKPDPIQHPRAHVIDFLQGAPELSDNTRALGADMSRQALADQLGGDQFTGGQMLPVPQMTAAPKAGLLDKFLNIGGAVGGMVGGVGGLASIQDALKKRAAGNGASRPDPNATIAWGDD